MAIRKSTNALTGKEFRGDVSTRIGYRPGKTERAASLYFHPHTSSSVVSILDPDVAEQLAEELWLVAMYLRGEEIL